MFAKDPELLQRLAARGIDATLAIHVNVSYTFLHCAKACEHCRSHTTSPLLVQGCHRRRLVKCF